MGKSAWISKSLVAELALAVSMVGSGFCAGIRDGYDQKVGQDIFEFSVISLADLVTCEKSRLSPNPLSTYVASLIWYINMAHCSDQIYLREDGRIVGEWDHSSLFPFADLNTLESH